MEGLVTLAIIVISAIGWIMNADKEQQQKQQQQQRPAPQNKPKRRLQEEIESFLKEIQQEQKQERPQEEPPRQAPPPVLQPERSKPEPKPFPVAPQGNRKQQQRRNQKERKSRPQSRTPVPPASSRESLLRDQTPAQLPAGNAMEGYLQTQAAQSFSRELQEILSPEQLQAVQNLVHQQAASAKSPAAQAIREMLSSQQNIQNAFVINEILQPPLSLRKK